MSKKMSATQDLGKVYKKDGEGNTYHVQQTVYKGKIINYAPFFTDAAFVLESLHLMESRTSDVWLISHPKSGTNWTYEILSILTSGKLQPAKVPLTQTAIEMKKTFERTENEAVPMVFPTHLKFDLMPKDVLGKQKIIYLVRNPKSVAVSFFSHRSRMKAVEYDSTFTGFLPVFLEEPLTCIGTWFDHVTGYWSMLKKKPNVLFVFFEDLVQNPLQSIQQISSFLGCNHNKEFLEEVVRLTSFENMKIVDQQRKDPNLKGYWKEENAGFVWKGKIDSWKTHFSVKQNEEFDQIYEKKMENHGDLKDRIKFE